MTRALTIHEVLQLHHLLAAQSGGKEGLRDSGLLDSSLAQPQMTFDGKDLYPSLIEKAAAVGFFLIRNHPFDDGNKRIGHATMETFLMMNGWEIQAEIDEQEQIILQVAAGEMKREPFTDWLKSHTRRLSRARGSE